MSNVNKQDLISALRTRLTLANVNSDALFSEALEVVVFGSRAVGVNRDTSDLDVLCFTNQKRRIRTRQLDCICYPHAEREGSYWRGSELASHIARYGVWIVGNDAWRNSVLIGKEAIERKQRKIESLIRNAVSRWQQFHPLFRTKYATSARRELQRLYLLETGVPIPPTPLLDSQWGLQRLKPQQLPCTASRVPGVIPHYARWISSVLCDEMEGDQPDSLNYSFAVSPRSA